NTFQCNFIGTNVAGTAIIPNEREGIRLTNSANGNLIGGTQANQRNLISANKSGQIDINESSANNIVQGNYVGTDVTGTIGLSYHVETFTIEVDDDSHDALIGGTTPGAGNLFSGNGGDGIQIDDDAYNVTVQGNLVGTDYTGTKALPNLGDGIEVDDDAFNVLIGGTTPAARNIISGNDEEAFQIDDRARNVFIYGNYIGTDITGTFAIPNGRDTSDTDNLNPLSAFEIDDGADSIFVGGLEPGQGNIISGNFSGGFEINDDADNVFIRGNKIGLNVNGDPLGNGNHGIYVGGDALNVVIEQNEIAFNQGAGILLGEESQVTSTVPTGVRISRNSIYNNAGLGIDITLGGLLPEARFLPGDGQNTNDPQDVDQGPNGLQNAPVLTSAETENVDLLIIKGTLNSRPNTLFRIEFFASEVCNGNVSGQSDSTALFGEGQIFLGFIGATSDSNGDLNFSSDFTAEIPDGYAITATATDPNDNTSEFSNCVSNVNKAPVTQMLTLDVVEDAYLENGNRFNNNSLRIEGDRRRTYLKFDPIQFNGQITAA
ncbi:MAG: right-handed parallel beta-helix repeat-containing protein, partial [Bacteroidota bacterium]